MWRLLPCEPGLLVFMPLCSCPLTLGLDISLALATGTLASMIQAEAWWAFVYWGLSSWNSLSEASSMLQRRSDHPGGWNTSWEEATWSGADVPQVSSQPKTAALVTPSDTKQSRPTESWEINRNCFEPLSFGMVTQQQITGPQYNN